MSSVVGVVVVVCGGRWIIFCCCGGDEDLSFVQTVLFLLSKHVGK